MADETTREAQAARSWLTREAEDAMAEVRLLSRHRASMKRSRAVAEREGRTWARPLIDGACDALRSALSGAGGTVARKAAQGGDVDAIRGEVL